MSALKRREGKVSLFKASPFGAPAPEAQESDDEGDDDFFSRSKHTYAILAAEEEDRKKRKGEREKDVELTAGATTPPCGKRQRVDDHAGYLKSTPSASGQRISPKGFTESPDASHKNKSTLREENGAPNADADLRRNQDATLPEIINLGDAESDKLDTSRIGENAPDDRPTIVPKPGPLLSGSGSNEISRSDVQVANDDEIISAGVSVPAPEQSSTELLAHPESNVRVSIFITSRIPNTSNLKVQRRLDQRLKEARLEWCHRQGYDNQMAAEVILTWRGKQVYDSTSCQGLGIGVNAADEISPEEEADLISTADLQIHMEAMTRQMLKDLKEVKSKPPTTREERHPSDEPRPVAPIERRVRLILKSKDRNEVKLMVKESHTIVRLMNAFRNVNEVDDDIHLSVYFDGEELDPNSTVASYDIGDMDTLDVFVRA